MTKSSPGVSRTERISDEGLKRLEKQLSLGNAPSAVVLAQWLRRYGEAARKLMKKYDVYRDEFDDIKMTLD